MVAQGVGRFARRAGADKRRKLSVAITVEKCIIFCMLDGYGRVSWKKQPRYAFTCEYTF